MVDKLLKKPRCCNVAVFRSALGNHHVSRVGRDSAGRIESSLRTLVIPGNPVFTGSMRMVVMRAYRLCLARIDSTKVPNIQGGVSAEFSFREM
jgi:hypothetical protein